MSVPFTFPSSWVPDIPSHPGSKVACKLRFIDYIERQRPSLRKFYNDESLDEPAGRAARMICALCVKGCRLETAVQLSLLALYDLRLLIDWYQEKPGPGIGGPMFPHIDSLYIRFIIESVSEIYDEATLKGVSSVQFVGHSPEYQNVTGGEIVDLLRDVNSKLIGPIEGAGEKLVEAVGLDRGSSGLVDRPLLLLVLCRTEIEDEEDKAFHWPRIRSALRAQKRGGEVTISLPSVPNLEARSLRTFSDESEESCQIVLCGLGRFLSQRQRWEEIRYLLLGYLPEPHLFTDMDIPVLEEYIRVRTHLGLGFDEMERENPSTAETLTIDTQKLDIMTQIEILGLLPSKAIEEKNALFDALFDCDVGAVVQPPPTDHETSYLRHLRNASPFTQHDMFMLETIFDDDTSSVLHRPQENLHLHRVCEVSVNRRWFDERDIGSGAFGTVKLQVSSDGHTRAVKRIHRPDSKEREVKALAKVADRDDLFVRFLGWYRDKHSCLYITMEYLEHGDLSIYLKTHGRVPEGTILNIITQVLHGLVVLHERNICHRDLKPQNILIASPRPLRVKIGDFGTSKYIKETELRTRVGTVEYTAPEVLGLWTSKTKRNRFPYALDIWSMGCIFYEMITSKRPFTLVHLTSTAISTSIVETETGLETGVEVGEEMDMQLFLKFCSGAIPLPLEEFECLGASKEAGLFVKAVLQADPSMRPSALECLEEAKRMVDI